MLKSKLAYVWPWLAFASCVSWSFAAGEETNPYNVLFIAIDDLRPELGCYGVKAAQSPNLDRFAESAVVFDRHYVQVATCGASRYALLTGAAPPIRASREITPRPIKANPPSNPIRNRVPNRCLNFSGVPAITPPRSAKSPTHPTAGSTRITVRATAGRNSRTLGMNCPHRSAPGNAAGGFSSLMQMENIAKTAAAIAT